MKFQIFYRTSNMNKKSSFCSEKSAQRILDKVCKEHQMKDHNLADLVYFIRKA
jgi:inorganic pyrophosphatase/exopolyphosphatase